MAVMERLDAGAAIAGCIKTYVSVQNAYDACAPEIRAAVDDMIRIVKDPAATAEEKDRAIDTIVDAMFPSLAVDVIDTFSHWHRKSEGARREVAQQEQAFADRVKERMKELDINQEQLAQKTGVGQPAISNMLSRRSRPQQRTIKRIAEALGVDPESLWPGFSSREL